MKESERIALQQQIKEFAIKDLDLDAQIRACQDERDAIDVEQRAMYAEHIVIVENHDVRYADYRAKLDALHKERRDLRGVKDLIRHRLQFEEMTDIERDTLADRLKEYAVNDLDLDAQIRACQDLGDTLAVEKRKMDRAHAATVAKYEAKYSAYWVKSDALHKESRELHGARDLIHHRLRYDEP